MTAGLVLVVSGSAVVACSTVDRARDGSSPRSTTSPADVIVTVASSATSLPTVAVARSRSAAVKPPGRSVFADPTRVGLAEALAACAFDWRQSLRQRIEAVLTYATPGYRLRVQTVSEVDRSNWAGTQADHATGSCRVVSSVMIGGAPNTPTTNYVRVHLVQIVSSPRHAPQSGPWLSTYRVLRQRDGRWLVDAELDGGG